MSLVNQTPAAAAPIVARSAVATRPRVLDVPASLGLSVLVYAMVANAWVVDDAYITFRSVQNLIGGYGPTWNVGERVQAFTHPLWMLVMSALYAVTSDVFYTSIVANLLLSFAAVLVVASALRERPESDAWTIPLFCLALLSSKAFIDYTSSGLENALSYFIAALFFSEFLAASGRPTAAVLRRALLWVSLAFVNRPESVLLYLPAIGFLLLTAEERPWARPGLLIISTLPATAWLAFSLVYYGFPFPNTAYAKSLCTGFPLAWTVRRGLAYAANSIAWDTASHVMLVAALLLAAVRRHARAALTMSGVVLYCAGVVVSFASTTHMSGRFFGLPFFVSIAVLVLLLPSRRAAWMCALALSAYLVVSPVSSLKFGTALYRPYLQHDSYVDTKWLVLQEGAALLDWRPGRPMPDHAWYHFGEQLRDTPAPVHLGGAFGGEAIGYVGYAAGPGKTIVDVVALGDPLLARLPAVQPPDYEQWKSGHFHRQLPDGYAEGLSRDENDIVDPAIHAYYAKIRNVTRAPLWRIDRWRDMWDLNVRERCFSR